MNREADPKVYKQQQQYALSGANKATKRCVPMTANRNHDATNRPEAVDSFPASWTWWVVLEAWSVSAAVEAWKAMLDSVTTTGWMVNYRRIAPTTKSTSASTTSQ